MVRGMIRAAALAGGVIGAATLSQYPEFSQQYTQRLAGQVDALTTVVMDFDASALDAGLGREQALAQMTGTDFLTARQSDMRRTFARHAVLSDTLVRLRAASPFERMQMPHRLTDTATFQATWGDYQPALPLTSAGAASAGLGGVAGWAIVAGLLAVLRRPFRKNPNTFIRKEPKIRGGNQ